MAIGDVECEGACEEHQGEVREVHVLCWGKFFYCEEAIVEDRRRGLYVTIVDQESEVTS